MSIIAIDIGYGYVKAISDRGGEVIFPSFVAPAEDLVLREVLKSKGPGHFVIVEWPGAAAQRYFVGDLAIAESRLATAPMNRDKWTHWSTSVLVLTALALLEEHASSSSMVVTGLPLDFYRGQRELVEKTLAGLNCAVTVDNHRRFVKVDKTVVFLQGAAAIYAMETLPMGRNVVVDIGKFTTNIMTFETTGSRVVPVTQYSGSVEKGITLLHAAVRRAFLQQYYLPLESTEIEKIVRDRSLLFAGRNLDLTDMVASAKAQAAQVIMDEVVACLNSKLDQVNNFVFCGGGAIALEADLAKHFPRSTFMADGQFANARGYLQVGRLALVEGMR